MFGRLDSLTSHYKSIYDNDYSNEFFRQFDLLRENMKEVNFYLSIICKIIFNDKKYNDIRNLNNDDLLSIQMLASLKDKKEMDIMKEQFITNQKSDLSDKIIQIKKMQSVSAVGSPSVTGPRKSNLYSKCKVSSPRLPAVHRERRWKPD